MIRFDHVVKRFGDTTVVDNISITMPAGSVTCLVGTSGAGKTTALRLINRLETPSAGRVFVDDQDIADGDVIALRRGIGYVIQGAALFPHRTAAQNVAVRLPAAQKQHPAILERLFDLVKLDRRQHGSLRPSQLSGGQQQRIGIARALANDPPIVLLDEPFGALDPLTRRQLERDVFGLFRALAKTAVMVTHDLAEARRVADHIVVLDRGRIEQQGHPSAIFDTPSTPFVRALVEASQ